MLQYTPYRGPVTFTCFLRRIMIFLSVCSSNTCLFRPQWILLRTRTVTLAVGVPYLTHQNSLKTQFVQENYNQILVLMLNTSHVIIKNLDFSICLKLICLHGKNQCNRSFLIFTDDRLLKVVSISIQYFFATCSH